MFFTRILFFIFCWNLAPLAFSQKAIEVGSWQGKLQLNDSTALPFRMVLSKGASVPNIQIQNGTEKIDLLFGSKQNDTLVYEFPLFDSRIHVVFHSSRSLKGYWINKNKKGTYTLPLTGHLCANDLFECQKYYGTEQKKLAKKWKVEFSPQTENAWPAIGLFEKDQEDVHGTFLTETGDYRFLDGNMYDNSLYLSCFDGSHAFLFQAELRNDTLHGVFYSGNHFSCEWVAHEDANYELPNANELTYVVNDHPLQFTFKDLNSKPYTFPNETLQNKVTIIQIMGTWCPNCMDETVFLQEMYSKYHTEGLEIIMIGYEAGNSEEEYLQKLKKFQERKKIPFTILNGGAANKNKAAEDFSMLNHIISFPTSIIIDRTGKIINVHTGFNGPSTGTYYTNYVQETEKLIISLLK